MGGVGAGMSHCPHEIIEVGGSAKMVCLVKVIDFKVTSAL